jgi:hypothetical protein
MGRMWVLKGLHSLWRTIVK